MKPRLALLLFLALFVTNCDKDEKSPGSGEGKNRKNFPGSSTTPPKANGTAQNGSDDSAVAPDTNVVTDEDENEAQPENNDTPIPQKALNDTPPVPQPEPRPISLAQKCFVTTNLYRTCISLDSAAEATVQDERELVSVFQKNCTDNLDGSLIVSCPSDAQVSCLTETVGASASGPIDINKLTRYYGMDESLKKTVQSSCKDSGKII